MGDLILREWRRDELRRIYVNDADTREPIGFFDRTTGEIVVRYKAREREVLTALKPFLLASAPIAAQRRADAHWPRRVRVEPPQQVEPSLPETAPAPEPEPLPEPVLESTPVPAPTPAPEPEPEPMPEPAAAPVEPLALAEPQPEAAPPPPAPEMDVDLSTDIDGATMQDRVDEAAQAAVAPHVIQDLAAGLASTFTARIHRIPAPEKVPVALRIPPPSRPAGGTRIVDKRLDRLRRDGWKILDSVKLGHGAVVEHLAIGRPGVFTIRAWNHAKARISVEGTAVRVDGTEYPYLDECRAEAENVARRLSSAGPNVQATAVLALVDVSELDLSRASAGLVVCRGEMVDHVLRDLPGILTNRDQMRVYDLAREPDIWRA